MQCKPFETRVFPRMHTSSSGTLFVISAPSGAGKTTLVRELLAREPVLRLSISHTTRAPRTGEENGVHYHFIDEAEFVRLREAGGFVEWAQVHGNFYGTSRHWLAAQLDEGADIVLEIDWQGAQQVRTAFGEHMVGIFILPPSLAVLEARLSGRATDDAATIARRLAAARGEMRHAADADYVILNDDLSVASAQLHAVIQAARLRTYCQRARHADYFQLFEKD